MIVEAVSEPAVLMDLRPGVDSSIAKLGCGRNGGITGFSVSLVVLDFMGLMSYQTGETYKNEQAVSVRECTGR